MCWDIGSVLHFVTREAGCMSEREYRTGSVFLAGAVSTLLDKMSQDYILTRDFFEHPDHVADQRYTGTAFHYASCAPIEIAEVFARHKNIPASHFLVGTKTVQQLNNAFGDAYWTPLERTIPVGTTPLMHVFDHGKHIPQTDLIQAIIYLKIFVDKACRNLKLLRCTCSHLNNILSKSRCKESIKMLQTIPRINTDQSLLSTIPGDILFRMISFGGEKILPHWSGKTVKEILHSVRNNSETTNPAGQSEAVRENLYDVFCKFKRVLIQKNGDKAVARYETMLENPMEIEEKPFDRFWLEQQIMFHTEKAGLQWTQKRIDFYTKMRNMALYQQAIKIAQMSVAKPTFQHFAFALSQICRSEASCFLVWCQRFINSFVPNYGFENMCNSNEDEQRAWAKSKKGILISLL